ncbi:unnamed protein product [Prorocentrum cordatum]|uniref:GATA-type domain-containing protein n=1 Tax=Prorocentrum cordatum TaxID=2364126 RepID=A0ABN9SMU5_9DINO|nr:unnamed protein product [Polarella glacialis]
MSRGLAADPWRCKECVTRDGTPWINRGDLKQCSKCNLHKGVCYGGPRTPKGSSATMSTGSPKASKDKSDTASMAKQLANIQAMVKKLTKQVKRDRITKKINALLKVYDGSSVASDLVQVKSLAEEKERLGKELDAERPLEDHVTSLTTRPWNSRAKAKRLREEHAQKQLVIDELVAKQTVLQYSLAEAEAEVARLEVEVQRLGADRAPPPTAGKPTLHELLPKFTVDVQRLGELAVELALDPSLQTELDTAAKVFGRLHELPQAKPPPAQVPAVAPAPATPAGEERGGVAPTAVLPAGQVQVLAEEAAGNEMDIDIDLMESAELWEASEAARVTQPDEATSADMRAHKRVLDSFTHAATAHKKKKKARSAPI